MLRLFTVCYCSQLGFVSFAKGSCLLHEVSVCQLQRVYAWHESASSSTFPIEQWKQPWLVGLYMGVILSSYIGIIINHYPTSIMESSKGCFRGWICNFSSERGNIVHSWLNHFCDTTISMCVPIVNWPGPPLFGKGFLILYLKNPDPSKVAILRQTHPCSYRVHSTLPLEGF